MSSRRTTFTPVFRGAIWRACPTTSKRLVDKVKLPTRHDDHAARADREHERLVSGLGVGMVFAVLLVYALMAVNFQSWIDPLLVVLALPGALSGILWMLFVTQTPLSVPALMGMIMGIGVATANSILLVTFANEQREMGKSALDAALEAGATRIRPVLMTAIAMMIGMMPMALGLSEGGEQNAPLGRAVIGALLVATFVTLFVVPVLYSLMRKTEPAERVRQGRTGRSRIRARSRSALRREPAARSRQSRTGR